MTGNSAMQWTNKPPVWREDGDDIFVQSAGQTDFWRITHDGGVRDNGHFFHCQVSGDFDARVQVFGQYQDQYDQAGLMVRIDESNWLKCGIELKDGVQYASTVVTRGWSDWSVIRLPKPESIWLEIHRRDQTFEVRYSLDNDRYQLMRQSYLPVKDTAQVGLMIASPIGDGFEAVFRGYDVATS
jgi:regulation of enolase protein 1 (concanavalin A-like superfamily)